MVEISFHPYFVTKRTFGLSSMFRNSLSVNYIFMFTNENHEPHTEVNCITIPRDEVFLRCRSYITHIGYFLRDLEGGRSFIF